MVRRSGKKVTALRRKTYGSGSKTSKMNARKKAVKALKSKIPNKSRIAGVASKSHKKSATIKKQPLNHKHIAELMIEFQKRKTLIAEIIRDMFVEDLNTSLYVERVKRIESIMSQISTFAGSDSALERLSNEGKMLLDLFENELMSRRNEEVIMPFEYVDEHKARIKGDVRIIREQFKNANPRIITVLFEGKKHNVVLDEGKITASWIKGNNDTEITIDGKPHTVHVEKALHYLRLAKAVNCLSSEIELILKSKADKAECEELKRIQLSYLEGISDMARSFVSGLHESKHHSYVDSYFYKLTKATMLKEAVNLCTGSTVHFMYEGKNMFGKLRGLVNDRFIVEVEDSSGFWLFKPRKVFHVEIDNIVYVRPEDLINQIRLKERIDELSSQIMDSSADPNKVLRNAISLIDFVHRNPKLLERVISLAKDYRTRNCTDKTERESSSKLDLHHYNQMSPEEKVLVLRDGIQNL